MNVEKAIETSQRALAGLAAALERGESEAFKAYLASITRFHRYSLRNALLIQSQFPGAQRVAGISTWNRLGRRVRKGQRGISILAPIVRRSETVERAEAEDDLEEEAIDECPRAVTGFRVAHVFDVRQTAGAPLPEPPCVGGDPGEFLDRLKAFIAEKQIQLSFSAEIAPARGVSMGGRIILLPDMTDAETLSVMAHELGHELLHDSASRREVNGRRTRELEAEAVAYVVGQGIGLECGTVSADYILHYDGNQAALAESLGRIQRTASGILAAIAPDV